MRESREEGQRVVTEREGKGRGKRNEGEQRGRERREGIEG